MRNDRFEEDGEIISRATIEKAIEEGEAYRILCDGKIAGGAVVRVNGDKGDLDLLFVSSHIHSKGIGYAAWREIERMYPQVKVWETITAEIAVIITAVNTTARETELSFDFCQS